MDGIIMSPSKPKGVVFREVQNIVKHLSKKGILIGLNSKNNIEDVEEVIINHPDFWLSNEQIVIKKVNWKNKAENLNEIAKELNIGIDSLVFIDDSDFEINLINEYVPEVYTIQVPKNIYTYPDMIRSKLSLFFNRGISEEDVKRVRMYKEQRRERIHKIWIENMEEYLRSLQLEMTILIDEQELVPRIAQLTQKTNQFNLTTKRYTESDISNFLKSNNHSVYAFQACDKYGDFGTTGVSILEIDGDKARIDTFLMSCRILGRKIEYRFLEEIFRDLKNLNISQVEASYLSTAKNVQTKDFFESAKFNLIKENESEKQYLLNLDLIQQGEFDFIKVKNGK